MPASKTAALQIEDLHFGYAAEPIFGGLSLSLPADQFVAVIGVNGSGKSTLLRLLLGLATPQEGRVRILGKLPGSHELKELLGCALQEIDFPSQLRVNEILHFVCAHYSSPYSVAELARDFALEDFSAKYCSELSGGMRRRLSLACAFAGRPKVVLLDEPSTGLDASSRQSLMEHIHCYRQEHAALVLMISHHPEEVMDYVDSMLLLSPGGQPRTILPEQFRKAAQLCEVSFKCPGALEFPEAKELTRAGDHYRVVTASSDATVRRLLAQTDAFSGLRIQDLSTHDILEHWL